MDLLKLVTTDQLQEKSDIDYSDVMALGFERKNIHDPVWEQIMGYPYFIVCKNYPGGQTIEWDIEDHTCTLFYGLGEDQKQVIINKLRVLKLVDNILENKI
jgi:hypothetical protein